MPYADDTASLFSTTTTLLELPSLTREGTSGFDATSLECGGGLSAEETFVTFICSYKNYNPDDHFLKLLERVGCPASFGRNSATGLTSLKKRLSVQIPRRFLLQSPTFHRNPRDEAEVQQIVNDTKKKTSEAINTLFDSERPTLLLVREREVLGVIITALLKALDLSNPLFVYPAPSIVQAPKWATVKNASFMAAASADVKWATLTILTPPAEGHTNEITKEQEAAYLKDQYGSGAKPRKTNAELLAAMWEPDDIAEQQLDRVLEALERRGGIWTHAAHRSTPGLRNPDPKQRPEFIVRGVFPLIFIERCRKYAEKQRMPMPSDVSPETKAKWAPIITSARGVASEHEHQSEDALAGCSIRCTDEPFKGAKWNDRFFTSNVAGGSGA
ncbi:hypothetical protein IE81DRAFT_324230 [Ceraceosorus guamensis]|uniref:Uncharacterized protein n=1 Tax=Ceraceosorus guamensis TaxID=1522189 RepID=A0A316VWC3_9BASI|nr:hypothetical protein IE81DRAFT_324230 [Ceraceosorus guamensis]PWN41739.1 hypothetical protein IE81DRAFT_324230 [Ceraceosorus guamensis]